MLVLSRKVGERLLIGDDIAITVVRIQGGGVRIGVEAPSHLAVIREELKAKLEQERGVGVPASAGDAPSSPKTA